MGKVNVEGERFLDLKAEVAQYSFIRVRKRAEDERSFSCNRFWNWLSKIARVDPSSVRGMILDSEPEFDERLVLWLESGGGPYCFAYRSGGRRSTVQ
jgi:hypothetical protein